MIASRAATTLTQIRAASTAPRYTAIPFCAHRTFPAASRAHFHALHTSPLHTRKPLLTGNRVAAALALARQFARASSLDARQPFSAYLTCPVASRRKHAHSLAHAAATIMAVCAAPAYASGAG